MKGWVTACAHLPRATNVLWAFRHADAMGVLEVKARPVDLTNCKRVPLASNAYDSSNQDLTISVEYMLGTLTPLLS